jgi:hypothetical protein
MMIQTAPPGEKRFISTMVEHLALCEQFARAWGNDDFERPEPFEEFAYTVANHDRGWDEYDARPVLDAASGMPAGLGSGPVPGVVDTSKRSPDFNEARHAYCGLLSSMHSWGLYNDRYGVSEFRVLDGGKSVPMPPGQEDTVNGLLEGEIARQQRLQAQLAEDPSTAAWVEEKNLFRNYKLLQFFDTLALYFNMRHAADRSEERFVNVPMSIDQDAAITVRPLGNDEYAVAPFPFAGDRLETLCDGRYFTALSTDDAPDDLGGMLYGLPTEQQSNILVRG